MAATLAEGQWEWAGLLPNFRIDVKRSLDLIQSRALWLGDHCAFDQLLLYRRHYQSFPNYQHAPVIVFALGHAKPNFEREPMAIDRLPSLAGEVDIWAPPLYGTLASEYV